MDNIISELTTLLARSDIATWLPPGGGQQLVVIDANSLPDSFRIGQLLGLVAKGRVQ